MSNEQQLALAARYAREMHLDGPCNSLMDGCVVAAEVYELNANDIWDEHEAQLDELLTKMLDMPGFGFSQAKQEDRSRWLPANRPMSRCSR